MVSARADDAQGPERRCDERRERDIIVADHGDVVWHPATGLGAGLEGGIGVGVLRVVEMGVAFEKLCFAGEGGELEVDGIADHGADEVDPQAVDELFELLGGGVGGELAETKVQLRMCGTMLMLFSGLVTMLVLAWVTPLLEA